MNLLEQISHPADFRALQVDQLPVLASEIRRFLIASISKTGGHIGANLGVIELTMAIHHVFEIGTANHGDALLFDVGHQGYTHKLLTGRMLNFSSLNQPGGMSRFISSHESDFDLMEASHGGTSISIACGLAMSRAHKQAKDKVIALIGDGSLVEGMAFEGLNFAPEHQIPLVIIINDNGMSIPPNLGAIHKLFSASDWQVCSRNWFEGMGLSYIPVADGHDFDQLLPAMEEAKRCLGPVVLHVKTEKGRGLSLAKDHPYKLHFSMPFDPVSGAGMAATLTGVTYQGIVGEELTALMDERDDVFALSPATPYASGIESLMQKYPDRALDVGMAEQHAMGMAAGLSMAGHMVFACFQATFMQRAIDQLFHDICYPGHDVTIISARSGFAGFDGATHHGIYDFGLLRSMPDLAVFYAGTKRDLRAIIRARADRTNPLSKGPMVILHPYETVPEREDAYLAEIETPLTEVEMVHEDGRDLIIAMPNRLPAALALQARLVESGQMFSVINLRWVMPLAKESLKPLLEKASKVITMEEGRKPGGIGEAINHLVAEEKIGCDVFVSAIKNGFMPAGDKETLSQQSGIDVDSILESVKSYWA